MKEYIYLNNMYYLIIKVKVKLLNNIPFILCL